jgi:hypothetical protein
MNHRKLQFVVGGAQKSGTTTLDGLLRGHPQIQMARVKETHFFDNEDACWNPPDYASLEAFFDEHDGRLRGESTPITMYWRPAVRRLSEYNPDIRIIVLLRNPAMRAFSNWRHERFHGREREAFSDAIRTGRERIRIEGTAEGLHRNYSYLERGFYAKQLLYLSKFIPKANIHCEIFEEFFADPSAGLDRITAFLGVRRFVVVPDLHLNLLPNLTGTCAPSDEDLAYLSGIYQEQNAAIEEFLGRRISAWRTSAHRA